MSFLEKLDQLPAEERWPSFRVWMQESPSALFNEVLKYRPIIDVPELTLVTRYSDCAQVLRQYDVFSVRLYVPKQGPYWMNQDDTARHWREKSIMRSILDFEALESIRGFVGDRTASLLNEAAGEIDVVKRISRAVPTAVVQEIFGLDEVDPKDLIEWSYWSQQDTFHNQAFDADVIPDQQYVTEMREKSSAKLAEYLGGLVQRRAADLQAGKDRNDPTTRLLRLVASQGLKFTPELVGLNVGGLLIGTVETTSHTVINALSGLIDPPSAVKTTLNAALKKDNVSDFDGHVFEMLRFKPAFPYFFRVCERPVVLGEGTDYAFSVPVGKTVLAVTQAAMRDEQVYPDPEKFDHTRSVTNAFTFGQGMHECLGRHIGQQIIPEIVRQVLLLPGLKAKGDVDYQGTTVPQSYVVHWKEEKGHCGHHS